MAGYGYYNDSTAYDFELFEIHERESASRSKAERSSAARATRSTASHSTASRSSAAARSSAARSSAARSSAARSSAARSSAARSSAAPAVRKKAVEPVKRMPRIRKVESKSSKQIRFEIKQNALRATVVLVFLAAVFSALSFQIVALTEQYELFNKINSVESQISDAKSESIRLNSKLNSMTSIGSVDEYATKILGMAKAEKYQVKCIDLSEGDKVLYSSQSQILSALSIKNDSEKLQSDGND